MLPHPQLKHPRRSKRAKSTMLIRTWHNCIWMTQPLFFILFQLSALSYVASIHHSIASGCWMAAATNDLSAINSREAAHTRAHEAAVTDRGRRWHAVRRRLEHRRFEHRRLVCYLSALHLIRRALRKKIIEATRIIRSSDDEERFLRQGPGRATSVSCLYF